jgi:glycine/D-amino acid oxidase-like deaminating enzyme/nitrite reductase/ring-hydroxylating ferredoxin subunit
MSHFSQNSTEPVWIRPSAGHSDELPATADIVIVGAGLAGLSVAYQLLRAGRKVVVIDRGGIGSGQTSCTSAHLTCVLDVRFETLERTRGREAALQAGHSHAIAIDCIEEAVEREGIECAFQRVSGYLFADPAHRAAYNREAEAVLRAGLRAEPVRRAPLPEFDTGPCLHFPEQAQFEPMAYLHGLARAVRQRGGRIVLGTPVREIEGGKFPRVETITGQNVECAAVVVATNNPINGGLALELKQAAYLTYVVALPVPAGRIPLGLYWDTDEPFHYIRLVPARRPGETDWLLVGGEDHRTGHARDGAERFARLEAWARARFPSAGPSERRWAGQVLQSHDGLAFIGHDPSAGDNVYLVTGDSGNGLTHGTVASLLLTGLILDGSHPWSALYDPARMPLAAVAPLLGENASAAWQFLSYLTPGDVHSADDIPPGSGAIIRVGMTKLAVYRDENGELHACSAVCPHRAGLVRWNEAEKTWDCPAHGSRFDCQGHVINGPAITDLQSAEELAEVVAR